MFAVALAMLLAWQAGPDPSAPLPPGKARIVFYRTGAFYFGGRGCSAYAGTPAEPRRVAALGRSEYVVLDVEPGTQMLSGGTGFKKPVALELAAGQTRYVRCEVAGMMGSSRLVLTDRLEFERHRPGLESPD